MSLVLKAPETSTTRILQEVLENADIKISIETHQDKTYTLYNKENDQSMPLTLPLKAGAVADAARKMLQISKKIPEKISIGSFFFYPDKSTFEKNGMTVSLTEKEVSLLLKLWEGQPHSVSKENLLESIWEYQTELETHTLETHIYRLRQKIESDPSHPEILVTDADGYKLSST